MYLDATTGNVRFHNIEKTAVQKYLNVVGFIHENLGTKDEAWAEVCKECMTGASKLQSKMAEHNKTTPAEE